MSIEAASIESVSIEAAPIGSGPLPGRAGSGSMGWSGRVRASTRRRRRPGSTGLRGNDAPRLVGSIRRVEVEDPVRRQDPGQTKPHAVSRPLASEVEGHQLRPHRGIGGAPRRRLEPEDHEFGRKRAVARFEPGVHAGDICVDPCVSTPDSGDRATPSPGDGAPAPAAGGRCRERRSRPLRRGVRRRCAGSSPSATSGPGRARSRARTGRPPRFRPRCAERRARPGSPRPARQGPAAPARRRSPGATREARRRRPRPPPRPAREGRPLPGPSISASRSCVSTAPDRFRVLHCLTVIR